jgi:hypothetical protein
LCTTGLTFGHLLDGAGRLRRRHGICPYAKRHLHDAKGNVRAGVIFAGEIEYPKQSAVVVAHVTSQEFHKSARVIQQKILDDYKDAKQTGEPAATSVVPEH